MITAWGEKQIGTWEAVATEETFLPDVAYQFSYTLPEKPWWASFLPWLPWPIKPTWLKDGIVKAIAATTEIPEDEVQVLWFSYNSDTNKFQIQIKWIPAAGAIPVAGVLIPIAAIITAIAIPVSLFIIGRVISDLAPETIEKLVEEVPEEITKGIKWLTILAGVLVTGSLISLFIPRGRKA